MNTKRIGSGTLGSNSHVSYLYQTSDDNANLIAASPELLEALEFVLEKCTLYGRGDAARELADKAIAKAYGEENV